ncbi:MAG: hypothetical protein ABIS29_07105 [Vicinamibacterales bacterium]
MFARRIVYTLCGVVLLGVLATSATEASFDTSRTTHFTFSGAVQLPGVTLPAGTYTFEVVNTNSGSDIVRVVARDRSKVYLMQFTRAVERARTGDLKATITLGETAAGTPPPVRAWYPQSETRGREFIY